ncbi:hypothetical protein HN695_02865 [Candidatus Woesearchaeota archaeon]|jgi:hypothetical protein|nr:hypothetical protein [Candidatus Woesearchaeota archaeon]MBT5272132.1 hypothetical protein [Candidatus Woesearchaeota archaeon]MBT6040935.1 hypothetical protein [Candidatus Woesearchaeota archaeon]MBT6336269.1 hypothetical protein [Candidatus Woesearchaeota archaeon]MBT7927252.1 hypothetical protein [Candidatus Woesearchaeota archaeon]
MAKKSIKKSNTKKIDYKKYFYTSTVFIILLLIVLVSFFSYNWGTKSNLVGEATRNLNSNREANNEGTRLTSANEMDLLEQMKKNTDAIRYLSNSISENSLSNLLQDCICEDKARRPKIRIPEEKTASCFDSDGGIFPGVAGETYTVGEDGIMIESKKDSCSGSTESHAAVYMEYYCENGEIKSKFDKCSSAGLGAGCYADGSACEPLIQ